VKRLGRSLVIWAMFVLSAYSLYSTYEYGRAKDLDAKLIHGITNDLMAISIAISEERYGFNEGYIGRPEVMEALAGHLAPDGYLVNSARHEPLAQDRDAIEKAFQAAVSLDPAGFEHFSYPKNPFIIMNAEDTGLVDLYRLSFRLFGYHADAMYRCVFLLLAASLLMFSAQARGSVWVSLLILSSMLSFRLLFDSGVFDTVGAPSVNSNRNLGMLGILATLHLMLYSHMQNRYDPVVSRLLWLMQLALLLFVMSVRSAVLWQWLALLSWLLAPVLWELYHNRDLRAVWKRYQAAIAAVACLLLVYQVVHKERMDRHSHVYFGDCTMPHHLRWHSAYLGLTYLKDWEKLAPPEVAGATGDQVGWNISMNLWKRRHGESFTCPEFPQFLRLAVHDRYMGKAYWQFFIKHPWEVLKLHAVVKPLGIYHMAKGHLQRVWPAWSQFMAGFALCGLLYGLVAGLGRRQLLITAAPLYMLLLSNMPQMFAYPLYMIETVWLGMIAGLIGSVALGAVAGNIFRKALLRSDRGLPAEGS